MNSIHFPWHNTLFQLCVMSTLKCLEKIESKTPESKEQAGSPILGRSLHSKQS